MNDSVIGSIPRIDNGDHDHPGICVSFPSAPIEEVFDERLVWVMVPLNPLLARPFTKYREPLYGQKPKMRQIGGNQNMDRDNHGVP